MKKDHKKFSPLIPSATQFETPKYMIDISFDHEDWVVIQTAFSDYTKQVRERQYYNNVDKETIIRKLDMLFKVEQKIMRITDLTEPPAQREARLSVKFK
jgi:hypothetical protein